MIARDESTRAVTPRAGERLLGDVLPFAAFLMLVFGFGTSQSDGSFGTLLMAVALGGVGVWAIRRTRFAGR